MCSYCIRVDPKSNKNILNKQRSRTHRQGKKTCEGKSRDWNYAATTKKPTEAARGKRGFFTRDFRLSVALPTP